MKGKTAGIAGADSLSVEEAARYVPEHYLKLLSDAEGSAVSKKEMGFIIRRSDIQSLRSYVREALLLSVDLKVIQGQLGYEISSIPALEPASIQLFNKSVIAHAGSWGALESETKELARKLDVLSKKYLIFGDHLLSVLRMTTPKLFLNGTLRDLTEVQKKDLSLLYLDVDAKDTVSKIKGYLNAMKDSAHLYIKEVDAVGDLALKFERVLTDQLIPAARLKVKAYQDSPLFQEQEDLHVKIKDLDVRIDELADEYKAHVGYSFTGLFFGAFGLAVTGGIYGSKAENARKLKNKLIAERKELFDKSVDNKRVIGLLDSVQLNLVDLRGRMLSAEVGAKQLSQVWSYIERYLVEAARSLDEIESLAQLHSFTLQFSLVLEPWRRIGNYSSEISSAFNDMIEEFV